LVVVAIDDKDLEVDKIEEEEAEEEEGNDDAEDEDKENPRRWQIWLIVTRIRNCSWPKIRTLFFCQS
jgi:hypothetical protein